MQYPILNSFIKDFFTKTFSISKKLLYFALLDFAELFVKHKKNLKL